MKTERVIHEVLDNILGSIVVFGDDGKITFINRVGIEELGYHSVDTDITSILSMLFHNHMNISDYIKTIDGTQIRTSVYRKNNTCFPALIEIKRVLSSTGENLNVLSIRNETDETIMEKELDQAKQDMEETMRVRNELVANITHELRTPVNGIKGHIKNLLSKEEDQQKRRVMEIISKCCLNMEKIINDLLEFSKLEAGKLQLNPQFFKLRECVEHAIETNMSVANEKGISLTARVSDDIPDDVYGDDLRIIQILNNLLSNAIKFTSIGSVQVEVHRTFTKGKTMELTFLVMDTGIGISPEEQDKLFHSFSQVDGSITRKYGGTGLGLFVTKQLVDLMHGTISVVSEKGKGSTFTFSVQIECENIDESLMEEKQAQIEIKPPIIQVSSEQELAYVYGSEENQHQIHDCEH